MNRSFYTSTMREIKERGKAHEEGREEDIGVLGRVASILSSIARRHDATRGEVKPCSNRKRNLERIRQITAMKRALKSELAGVVSSSPAINVYAVKYSATRGYVVHQGRCDGGYGANIDSAEVFKPQRSQLPVMLQSPLQQQRQE